MRLAAFYSQLNSAKSVGNRILNFCVKFFYRPQKSKKSFEKNFLTLEGSKNFLGQNFENLFHRFLRNLVVSRMPPTASRYLENCRRRSISCKPLLFQHKLATVTIFKISLIDPLIDPFNGGMIYFGII